ncbi:MAG: hypothetical protein NTU94_05455 [Planctomycetota bacterium]|nr:hypothetical protein [Planctomycetota bacterium]
MRHAVNILTLILFSQVLWLSSGLAAPANEPASSPPGGPSAPPRGLRYYGHYWVESKPYGSHLDEVGSHCNVHFVENVDGLKKCASKGVQCILQVRWEFFAGGGGNSAVPNPLRPDYESLWNHTAEQVMPSIDRVEAFYMIDEPYLNGVSKKDLDTAIAAVKARFPRKPVMVIFAVSALTQGLAVPAGADWLGFDCYESIGAVAKHLRFLKSKVQPHQRLFLVPQSFLNKAAPTDEGLARLNRQYYELASSEPLVIGLLNFGLFTDPKAGSIPLTLQMQRKIGEAITSKDRRPQDSSKRGSPRR